MRTLMPSQIAYAEFTPQAWVGDYAVEVDPEGPRDWSPSIEVRVNDLGLDVYDELKSDPSAPEWVREWTGPFSIYVTMAAD